MPTLSVQAVQQAGMHFVATSTDTSQSVSLDYPLRPDETPHGLKPLEALLGSLATCAGSALWLLLSRGRQPVRGITVNARAERRDEHPTVLTSIALEIVVSGAEVDASAVGRALAAAEEKLCPVWAMLKASTPITATFRVAATP